jgi:hypothetical protein
MPGVRTIAVLFCVLAISDADSYDANDSINTKVASFSSLDDVRKYITALQPLMVSGKWFYTTDDDDICMYARSDDDENGFDTDDTTGSVCFRAATKLWSDLGDNEVKEHSFKIQGGDPAVDDADLFLADAITFGLQSLQDDPVSGDTTKKHVAMVYVTVKNMKEKQFAYSLLAGHNGAFAEDSVTASALKVSICITHVIKHMEGSATPNAFERKDNNCKVAKQITISKINDWDWPPASDWTSNQNWKFTHASTFLAQKV